MANHLYDNPWSDENVAKLKKLWSDGVTASRCATLIGCGITRNAVIGKVHRLDLEKRGDAIKARFRPTRAPKPKAKRQVEIGEIPQGPCATDIAPEPDAANAATMTSHAFGGCAWPVGEVDGETLFCCGPQATINGPKYCLHHLGRAYKPATAAKAAAQKSDTERLMRRFG